MGEIAGSHGCSCLGDPGRKKLTPVSAKPRYCEQPVLERYGWFYFETMYHSLDLLITYLLSIYSLPSNIVSSEDTTASGRKCLPPSSVLREERLGCKAVMQGVTNGEDCRMRRRRRETSEQALGDVFV